MIRIGDTGSLSLISILSEFVKEISTGSLAKEIREWEVYQVGDIARPVVIEASRRFPLASGANPPRRLVSRHSHLESLDRPLP